MDKTPEQIIAELGVPHRRVGRQYKIQCYNTVGHKSGDRNPSLTLYDNGYYCFACGEHGTFQWLIKQFGGYTPPPTRGSKMPEPVKEYKKYNLGKIWKSLPLLPEETREKLAAKGFAKEQLEEAAGWRWHTNEISGWKPGIFMPYRAGTKLVSARLRTLHGDTRFMSLPGGESWPYCYNQLSRNTVFVTEGESDCLTLNFAKIPTVGIPGSTNTEAIRKTVAAAKENGSQLIVVPDNDEAGQTFKARVMAAALEKTVKCREFIVPAPFKDINEWYVAVGGDAGTQMQETIVAWLMDELPWFAQKVKEVHESKK